MRRTSPEQGPPKVPPALPTARSRPGTFAEEAWPDRANASARKTEPRWVTETTRMREVAY